jgi:hypothetical protein
MPHLEGTSIIILASKFLQGRVDFLLSVPSTPVYAPLYRCGVAPAKSLDVIYIKTHILSQVYRKKEVVKERKNHTHSIALQV